MYKLLKCKHLNILFFICGLVSVELSVEFVTEFGDNHPPTIVVHMLLILNFVLDLFSIC